VPAERDQVFIVLGGSEEFTVSLIVADLTQLLTASVMGDISYRPGLFEDCPDRGGANLAAYAGEFSGDAPVAPPGILLGHAQDQFASRGLCGWSSWSSARVSPASLDQVGVPA
jgi:hypothetical protein